MKKLNNKKCGFFRIFECIFDRFNAKSVSYFIAFVLAVTGIYMAITGIYGEGEVNITTALLSGKIKTGSLGLIFTFLGVIIVLILALRSNKKYKICIKKNDLEITWEGKSRSSGRVTELVQRIIKEITGLETRGS